LVIALLSGVALHAQARSIAEILKSQELRACIALVSASMGSAQPEGCRDNCTITGDNADLTAAFVRTFGPQVKLKWLNVGWAEQFQNQAGEVVKEAAYTPRLLASGECDLYVTTFIKNEWRATKMDFAPVNLSRMLVLTAKAKAGAIAQVSDLAGKRAATYRETVYEGWLQAQNAGGFSSNPVEIQYVKDEDAAVQALLDQQVDFALMVTDTALPYLKQNSALSATFGVGAVSEQSWAFRKDDQDLVAAANRFLRAQRQDAASLLNQQFRAMYGRSVLELDAYVRQLK
jgi:hypothetical protein